MFHKLVQWAHEHKYMAIATGLAIVVLLYLLLHSGGSKTTPQTAEEAYKAQQLADNTQIQIAKIQAQAAETPYNDQAGVANNQANKTAQVQSLSIVDALKEALASITGSVTLGSLQSNNALSLGELQSNNNLLGIQDTNKSQLTAQQSNNTTELGLSANQATLEEFIATLEKTGNAYYEGLFPGGAAGLFQWA